MRAEVTCEEAWRGPQGTTTGAARMRLKDDVQWSHADQSLTLHCNCIVAAGDSFFSCCGAVDSWSK